LVLALWLAKSGLTVRIIDQADAPGTTSRAILFHARNLEFYDQLGIAQPAVERGVEFSAVNLWRNGTHVGRVSFADLGAGISPYPYVLIFPQDQQEQLLIKMELLSFTQTVDGVQALVKDRHGDEQRWDAGYLAGCDGAHSLVREALGVGFPGGGYDDLYYVADIDAEGPVANGEMHGALDDAEFLAIFASLRSRDWQVHVYGRPSLALSEACAARGLALHAFPWQASMRRAGVRRDAAYLVRPDGYVAFADQTAGVASLERYLDERFG
jgi:2-polyprenyl-6-methoxyphenol hydroxylase-like FAD-dependent oxidoreductase